MHRQSRVGGRQIASGELSRCRRTMSAIPPQRIRLSPSSVAAAAASSKPVRPTLPLALMRQGSPTQRTAARRASPSPPVCWAHDSVRMKSRQSPDQRISPETKASLAAQGPKGATCLSAAAECKGKPLSLLGGLMRRTASLDAICLTAQWPRDLHSYCGRPMVDRATQTPDDWKEVERIKFVQKKATLPPGDSLEMKYIRQRLQRTAQGGRTSPRWSPVQGDHQLGLAALSPPPSPSVAPPPPSGPIPIQQPRPGRTPPGGPRMRNSVEGLNQEIERLVLKGISGAGTENEAELERVMGPTPEGHRAPIAELFHSTCCSVDTQTPSGSDGSNGFLDSSSRHGSSRPDSLECDKSASPDLEVSGHTSKLGTSPQINKFLTREPPDGCEKVKIIDEGRKPPTSPMAGGDGPGSEGAVLKPSSQFVLRPSQSSAFCPLVRNPFQGVHRGPIVDPFLLNERLQ